jgi:hypothetical protein
LQALEERGALKTPEPKVFPNSAEDSIGIAYSGQIDEDNPVSEMGVGLAADLEDQSGFAYTARTCQGEQPDLISKQE